MGKFMKDKWANLLPSERVAWKEKMCGGGSGADNLIKYHNAKRPENVKKFVEMMSVPPDATIDGSKPVRYAVKGGSNKHNPRFDSDDWLPRGTCTMIAAHHEMMKDDPERLTTAFMEELCGVDCKCKLYKKKETTS
jgi:hypothetical protein